MKFLYIGSFGSEDPTRAGLTFVMAKGAKEAGHDVEIALTMEDAVVLFNEAVAANVQPMGLPSLKELLAFARTNKISVCG